MVQSQSKSEDFSVNIGIIDADLLDNGTRHPNLALMKISGYYKAKGYDVELVESYESLEKYDRLFMSKVFSFTNVPKDVLSMPNLTIGGTGFYFDKAPDLPYEIEHHMPDYDLYSNYIKRRIAEGAPRSKYADYLDYSIGFTTRGCFRKCEFCVNKKYDKVFRHSSVKEFLCVDRPYIYLWDDNILAYPKWEEVIDELEATGKPFQFRQGLDLRLMTDKKAERFTSAKYQGDFIFAFDHLSDRDKIISKVQLWKRHSSKVCKMYVLTGFESQDAKNIEDTFERIKILMCYGSLPYVMRHENYNNSKYRTMYVELARWCNQPQFFKKKSFREFCLANQEYKKNQSTNCSAYQAMLDFEKAYPDIARKYFDLRFEEENIYKQQYGFGRRYANKPSCEECKKNLNCWLNLLDDSSRHEELLEKYLSKQIDLQCLSYPNAECRCNIDEITKKFVKIILSTPLDIFSEIVKKISNREKVVPDNIPQFSDMATAMYYVPEVLKKAGTGLGYAEIGEKLLSNEKNNIANKKYGENHSKLAAMLDLAVVSKDSSSAVVSLSILGGAFCNLTSDEKDDILAKLCYRIPIIQKAICADDAEESLLCDMQCLASTTKLRRLCNVRSLLEFATSR